jgi:hypothetical protein
MAGGRPLRGKLVRSSLATPDPLVDLMLATIERAKLDTEYAAPAA